jgi:hypothetical protein
MNRTFIRNNITSISIIIFIILFTIIQIIEPAFLYDRDGSFRSFGIGKQKKTIIPIWLVTIILAILVYLFVLYYLAIPKF